MHPPKQLRQSFRSRSVFQKNRPQRWDRADGQAFDDLSLPEKCAPIAHGSEGRAYSSPSNPGRAASPIYSDLIATGTTLNDHLNLRKAVPNHGLLRDFACSPGMALEIRN